MTPQEVLDYLDRRAAAGDDYAIVAANLVRECLRLREVLAGLDQRRQQWSQEGKGWQ